MVRRDRVVFSRQLLLSYHLRRLRISRKANLHPYCLDGSMGYNIGDRGKREVRDILIDKGWVGEYGSGNCMINRKNEATAVDKA